MVKLISDHRVLFEFECASVSCGSNVDPDGFAQTEQSVDLENLWLSKPVLMMIYLHKIHKLLYSNYYLRNVDQKSLNENIYRCKV